MDNCLYNSGSSLLVVYYCSNIRKSVSALFRTECLLFKRKLTKKLSSLIFLRSMYLTYEKTVTVKNITLFRFIAPDKGYLSGDIYPPNKGFCVPPGCLPTGLLNVSLCQPMSKI